jgi:7-cyano-7-deazaguanine synthase
MSKRETAVVLVSGGMDSCVTAAVARETYDCAYLHTNYGQRTERRELKAFNAVADHYGVERRLVVSIEHLKLIGGSGLTDHSIEIPAADIHRKGIPVSYVPFRNANLLSIAVSWAEVLGARAVFIGAVEEDSSGYPDCRQKFYDAFNAVIEAGTKPETRVHIETPIIHLSKAGIVKLGLSLQAPLHLTWSCYQREDLACGVCDSCALRLRGFQSAGQDDPIPYAQKPSYM